MDRRKTRTGKGGANETRDSALVAMRLKGASLATIARRFGLTQQSVGVILLQSAMDQVARGDATLSDKLYSVWRKLRYRRKRRRRN
jgi:hypothetical protein